MNASKLIYTFFFMVVIALVTFPKSTLAGKCGNGVCNKDETENSCPADCSDGGSGDPPVDDAVVYTVELTAGAFRFVNGAGSLIYPIHVITDSNKDIGLVPLYEYQDVEMHRPPAGSPAEQATWDRMFAIGCPELGTDDPINGFKIDKILSSDWGVGEPGNYRIILRDIRLTANGVAWDVTMQLIGPPNYTPYSDGWLPDGGPHDFYLERGKMWGREVSGGGPGGRKSCHQAYSGTDESMEGFSLCTMVEGTCATTADATMQIAICDADCFANMP